MNYEDMTLTELKSAAKELGIKGVSAMKKGELLDLLEAIKNRKAEYKITVKDEANQEEKPKKENVQVK